MSLFLATFLAGSLLLLLGIALYQNIPFLRKGLQQLPRSPLATLVLFGLATAWVLWNITNLGEADFGNWKNLLFALFLLLAVASYLTVPDFLAVVELSAPSPPAWCSDR